MNRKKIKFISLMTIFGSIVFGFSSCSKHNENSPGVEFMPDMYRSPSLESNLAYVNKKGDTIQTNRTPVAGSIARGYIPYGYANTPEGYESAGINLHNPLEKNEIHLAQGEVLYGKFCVHCHGTTGEGDGLVADKLPGAPPSYKGALKTLPEGKIFHSITYGKGLMGAHASQLTKDERWKITMYVLKLQGNDPLAPVTAVVVDSTAKKIK